MNKDIDSFDDDKLKEEAPLLSGIGKNNPFTVPDGYFDELPALIIQKCRESNKKPSIAVADKTFWLFRPQWMLASFIVVVAICFSLRKNDAISAINYEAIAAAIPDSAIEQSLQNNIDYVDVTNLEELAQNSGNIGSLPSMPEQDTANGQVINYLMNSNIDASDIENEL
jgi:hypothetical protein